MLYVDHMYYMLFALERLDFSDADPRSRKRVAENQTLPQKIISSGWLGRLSDGIRTALCWPQVVAVIYILLYIYR